VNCWRFNLVRVQVAKYLTADANNSIEQIVNTLTPQGVVVMIEAHDRTGSFYEGADLTNLANYYRNLAITYKNNPYVWFDVMNEPGSNQQTAPDRAHVMKQAIETNHVDHAA
jgi:mannan endo-1,4-beta-mannosidase